MGRTSVISTVCPPLETFRAQGTHAHLARQALPPFATIAGSKQLSKTCCRHCRRNVLHGSPEKERRGILPSPCSTVCPRQCMVEASLKSCGETLCSQNIRNSSICGAGLLQPCVKALCHLSANRSRTSDTSRISRCAYRLNKPKPTRRCERRPVSSGREPTCLALVSKDRIIEKHLNGYWFRSDISGAFRSPRQIPYSPS